MRFKLTLHIDKQVRNNTIPINYQYECCAVIYKIFSRSNEEYAFWLHKNGYTADKKQFKLFTFSRFFIQEYKVNNDLLNIFSDTITWYISFLPEVSTCEFIKGIFKDQEFDIGNQKAKIKCRVQNIEMIPSPIFSDTMTFKTISPMCLTLKRDNGTDEYISPSHSLSIEIIKKNLYDKYKSYKGNIFNENGFPFNFNVLGKEKSSLITIKEGMPQESKIRGYNCKFQITTHPELMNIMYQAGIGSKNSMGFGMVEEWKENE
jgi:CRISPR-associated endoribonuclease Cas6